MKESLLVEPEMKGRAGLFAEEAMQEVIDLRCLYEATLKTKRSLDLVQSWKEGLRGTLQRKYLSRRVENESAGSRVKRPTGRAFSEDELWGPNEKLEEEGGLDHPMTCRETGWTKQSQPRMNVSC